ncbi:MAG TPA: YfiR family protein [Stellaceae bacterium]|nr:YfiR family protein [Stellaceae bacterium]HEV2336786.1 YfiR family protein [Stellaceae bacterium]
MKLRTVLRSAWALAAVLACALPAQAQNAAGREAAIKAAFLYNFAKFTEWADHRFGGESDPAVFCVGADSPMRPAISALQGQLIRSHPIEVMAIVPGSRLSPCHVLFVDDTLPGAIRRRLEGHEVRGVLTVSDLPNFARSGGDIGLYYESNHLRFEINIGTAGKGGITFSSKLLQLAVVIGRLSSRQPASLFADIADLFAG